MSPHLTQNQQREEATISEVLDEGSTPCTNMTVEGLVDNSPPIIDPPVPAALKSRSSQWGNLPPHEHLEHWQTVTTWYGVEVMEEDVEVALAGQEGQNAAFVAVGGEPHTH